MRQSNDDADLRPGKSVNDLSGGSLNMFSAAKIGLTAGPTTMVSLVLFLLHDLNSNGVINLDPEPILLDNDLPFYALALDRGLTSIPDCFSNIGTKTSSSPLSCVLVVVARVMRSSGRVEREQAATASSNRRMSSRAALMAPPVTLPKTSASVDHLPLHERRRPGSGSIACTSPAFPAGIVNRPSRRSGLRHFTDRHQKLDGRRIRVSGVQ